MKMDIKKLFKKKRAVDYIIYAATVVAVIFLDQLTKYLTVSLLKTVDTSVKIINIFDIPVLNFTYILNDGAAFGMLDEAPWVFNSVSIIGIIAMSLYLFLGHTDSLLSGISLSMIIAGGIGNMIDRLTTGLVVDFIDFRFTGFAIFNIADTFVCVGAGILILSLLLELRRETKAEKEVAKNSQAEMLNDTEADADKASVTAESAEDAVNDADGEADAAPSPDVQLPEFAKFDESEFEGNEKTDDRL